MIRLPRFLSRLVAMALLVQAVLAPAHCLAMAATPSGLAAVICSADGTRTIHVGPDGQEMPVHDSGAGACLACPALPQAVALVPPAVPAPAWVSAPVAWHALAAEALPPAARAPPFAPRAPPAFG